VPRSTTRAASSTDPVAQGALQPRLDTSLYLSRYMFLHWNARPYTPHVCFYYAMQAGSSQNSSQKQDRLMTLADASPATVLHLAGQPSPPRPEPPLLLSAAHVLRIARQRRLARQKKRRRSWSHNLTEEALHRSLSNRLAAKEKRRKRLNCTLRLASINAHPRDTRITFIEETHVYTLDAVVDFPISVSGVWSQFFEVFDMEGTAWKYFERWASNSDSKYYVFICNCKATGWQDRDIIGKIIDTWRETGRIASHKGTYMHRQIELFLNAEEADESLTELQQFQNFMTEVAAPRMWTPFRTEWSIFDESRMIAGQVDCIFKHAHKEEYHMVDWKRCAKPLEPSIGAEYGRYGTGPCSTLLDNAWSHYAAQQNLYAAILKDTYALPLQSMSLLQLHETHNAYTLVPIPNLIDTAREMLDLCAYSSIYASKHLCPQASHN
jgi:hypothetical protein